MPIPDPTTPKDSSVSCHHGGPSLETPGLKPYSLSGGDGKNTIMFVKSRSGNLICMDEAGNIFERIDAIDKNSPARKELRGEVEDGPEHALRPKVEANPNERFDPGFAPGLDF